LARVPWPRGSPLTVAWPLLVTNARPLVPKPAQLSGGALVASPPAITVIDPPVAVPLGVTEHDENSRHGVGALRG